MPAQQQQQTRRTSVLASDLPWPEAIYVNSTLGTKTLISTAVLLTGWSVVEDTGTAKFQFALYDGPNTAGVPVAAIGAAANGDSSAGPGWPGILFRRGVYFDVISGSFYGSIWVVPVPPGWL